MKTKKMPYTDKIRQKNARKVSLFTENFFFRR